MPVVHDFAQYLVTGADMWWYQGSLQGLNLLILCMWVNLYVEFIL